MLKEWDWMLWMSFNQTISCAIRDRKIPESWDAWNLHANRGKRPEKSRINNHYQQI